MLQVTTELTLFNISVTGQLLWQVGDVGDRKQDLSDCDENHTDSTEKHGGTRERQICASGSQIESVPTQQPTLYVLHNDAFTGPMHLKTPVIDAMMHVVAATDGCDGCMLVDS